ncbi:ABC transporter permease [Lachnospiraceae bacterium ZAX-1]
MLTFSSLLSAMPGAAAQGVLWGIMAVGVYITYKILDIADLTVDGSFAFGGSVCAVLTLGGLHPVVAVLIAIFAGAIAGLITGILHAVFDIPAILAGILTQLALYSTNLRVMGRSNTPLLKVKTVVNNIQNVLPEINSTGAALLIGGVTAVVAIVILYWFFGTEVGNEIRATGNNEAMVKALGGNTRLMKVFGLMISNGFVALAGALVCQTQGYADVNMGTGAIVTGLAAIVIGNVLMGWAKSFASKMVSVLIGSIIYRMIIAVVLQFGFIETTDLKLFSAIVVAVALSVPVMIDRQKSKPRKDI